MASKQRKPLIAPDAISRPVTSPQSTISRIIEQDRQASGRAPIAETEQASELVTQLPSPLVHHLTSEPEAQHEHRAPELASPPVNQLTGAPVNQLIANLTPRERRRRAEDIVEAMSKSPMKQIGPRIPGEWDEWLENYVHVRRHSGLEKQKLVRDLIRNFITEEIAKEP